MKINTLNILNELRFKLLIPFSLFFFFTSCIQDEAPNSEADILECTVPDLSDDFRDGPKVIQLSLGSNSVKIWVTPDAEIGILSPEFKLTSGATIEPASGTPLDFTSPQKYIVTSENRKYTKEYIVEALPHSSLPPKKSYIYSFEHFKPAEGKLYQIFYEVNGDREDYIWASGNPGFALTQKPTTPAEQYPTASTTDGKVDNGIKLVTRSTGNFGRMAGMPIAAGSIFLGTFDVTNAMTKPLEATRFGLSMKAEPETLKVWYKYQGLIYQDKNGNDKMDIPSIYAVLYEPVIIDGEAILLHGDNVWTADNIIMSTKLNEDQIVNSSDINSADYIQASLSFTLRDGKSIDQSKLMNGNYYFTMVFASSDKGKYFEGAVGSTLCVDEVELICK